MPLHPPLTCPPETREIVPGYFAENGPDRGRMALQWFVDGGGQKNLVFWINKIQH
jgi:hypothetical protein